MNKISVQIIFLLSTIICSCNNFSEEKFDRTKWNEREDAGHPSPARKRMLKDLTTNHKLVGIKYFELLDILGKPNISDINSLSYDIIIDYGHDIDPVYTKKLTFIYSKDSIITSFKVEEWPKPR